MELSTFLFGGTLVGVLASLWSYVKLFVWRLVNLLVVKVRYEGSAGRAFSDYCWRNLRRSPFGEKRYNAENLFVRPTNRHQLVGFQLINTDFSVFWLGWRPLVVYWQVVGDGRNHIGGHAITALFLRWTFHEENLLVEAVDHRNDYCLNAQKRQCCRFRIQRHWGRGRERIMAEQPDPAGRNPPRTVQDGDGHGDDSRRYLKWSPDDLGPAGDARNAFVALALPAAVETAVRRVERWLASEAWYKDKRIPWRLGFLLYGPPGTGKSSVVKAIGQKFDLPVHTFDLTGFSNEQFINSWDDMLADAPCIALIEDIDGSFHGRDNVLGDRGGGLTFDCLLNAMSGVGEANGILVAVTTNRPELLDEALGRPDPEHGDISSRPGRIDYTLELGPLDADCRRRLARRILSSCPERIDELVEVGDGDTGAQFQKRCEEVALAVHWSDLSRNGHADRKLSHSAAQPVKLG